jgi:histidinol-phosphatase (PHP family)
MSLLFDDHVHSSMSPDARDGVDVLCRTAIDRGLAGLAFTDHFDTEPADPGYGHYDFDRLSQAVDEARRAWGGRLQLLVGAEVCFQPVFLPRILAFLRACPLDFVLGSVHWVNREFIDEAYFERHAPAEAYSAYFAAVEQAVASGLFDSIAHLDLPKRHSVARHGPFDPQPYQEQIDRILSLMVERQTALEINTSGWRRAAGEVHPAEAILRRFRELGGTRITIGADSHRALDLGRDIARAQALARAAGFTHLTRFVGREPVFIPL